MTASHSASVMLKLSRSRRMPALLITTSSPPKCSTAWSTSASAPAQVEMSSVLATACAAGGHDLVDDLLRRAGVGPAAVGRAAQVVHDHAGAFGGEQHRLLATDAATGSGDERHLAVEDPHVALSLHCRDS